MQNISSNPWQDFFTKSLQWHQDNNLYRSLKTIDCPQGKMVKINDLDYLHFSSNDYLGLANNNSLKTRSIQSLKKWGTGSGSSPLISGYSRLYQELEHNLTIFKETEAGLVFTSGYAANTGVISQLTGSNDLILSDELNHASIVDGCRLSKAKTVIFPHCDLNYLEKILAKYYGHGKTLIVTDAIFSMDGDLAPLADLISLCHQYGAMLYVDDAHGTGVLGQQGKGSLNDFNLSSHGIVQIGTFSKALGSLGGFVVGSKGLIEYLVNKSRSFIYSTALPPSVLATNLEAIRYIQVNQEPRDKLNHLGQYLRQKLLGLGLNIGGQVNHILTIIVGSAQETIQIADYLWQRQIYIPPIRPPTVPKDQSRLRISLSANHDIEDLNALISSLEDYSRLGA